MPNIDLLSPNYEVGDRLKADDINALISWAQQVKFNKGFLSDNTQIANYKPRSRKAYHLMNTTGEAIKPFSVFSIIHSGSSSSYSSGAPVGLPEGNAQQFNIDPNASTFLFLTNGSLEIPPNGEFETEFISFNKPTRVRVSANDIPEVGEPCGISFGEMRVGRHTNGLICLTPSFVERDEVYAFVCRSREPIKVVGCVTSKITKATKVGSQTLAGYGQIQVVYRNHLNLLDSVNRPAFPQTSRWNLKVFNYTPVEYPVGMMLSATDTLGVGLTVDFEQENKLCLAGSSLSSRSSSSRSSSSRSSSSLSSGSSSSSLSSSSLSSLSLSSASSSSVSRSFIINTTCCRDIYGVYPGGTWPLFLNLTLFNACCANLNQTVRLDRFGPGPIPVYMSGTSANAIKDCNGNKLFPVGGMNQWWLRAIVQCVGGTRWKLEFQWVNWNSLSPNVSPLRCVIAAHTPTWGEQCYMDIYSCDPIDFIRTNIGINYTLWKGNPFIYGTWCDPNGTFDAEVTE